MDIVQLKYFQVIANLQHMTKAAEALHIAQPALSRTLKNLEDEFELKLFDRIGKRIYLNQNGKILLSHVNVVLQELEDAKKELSESSEQAKMVVSLSMQAASKLLPEIIRGFKARHPHINLQIMQYDGAGDEKSDITIYSSIRPPADPNSVVLLEEEIVLAVPASNPLSRHESLPLAQTANEPFICLYKNKGLRVITDEYCHMAGFSPRTVIESDNPATIRELIAVNVGLSFIPLTTWHGLENDPNITFVRISEPKCTRCVNMSWRKKSYITKASTLLREYLVEYFNNIKRLAPAGG